MYIAYDKDAILRILPYEYYLKKISRHTSFTTIYRLTRNYHSLLYFPDFNTVYIFPTKTFADF